MRKNLEHDIHEICETREMGAAAFVAFAHFANIVFRHLPFSQRHKQDRNPLW